MTLNALNVNVIASVRSSKLAVQALKETRPDFVIVDLILKDREDGFDFIKLISKEYIPYIICTAYPSVKNLNEAFLHHAAAFFSKPLDKSAFTYSIKQLITKLENNKKDLLLIKDQRNLIKVPQKEIVMIKSEGNYSYVYLMSGKKFVQKISLRSMMNFVNNEIFIQCFRSILVNKNAINGIDSVKEFITMSDGRKVPVGSKYRNLILDYFKTLD